MATRECWKPVIGLEIHLQLDVQSKMFSSEPITYNKSPNAITTEVTLAEPGALPAINKEAVDAALKLALSFKSNIAEKLVFDRKNYFYPDLPKGYQITQYRHPLARGGKVTLASGKTIRLDSLHLEEDSAKSTQLTPTESGLDFNRSGIPLIEVVTTPTIHEAEIASTILEEIARTARYLEISKADLEKGSLRCDTNISLKNTKTGTKGDKTEIKNLNSYSQIRQSLNYEITRQRKLLEKGREVVSETRTFDTKKRITLPMREKELSESYRYTPEFDLKPVKIHKNHLEKLEATLPELPSEKEMRFREAYALSSEKAKFLSDNINRAALFENLAGLISEQKAANWLMGPVQQLLNKKHVEISQTPLKPTELAKLIKRVENEEISRENAEQIILPALIEYEKLDIDKFIKEKNLWLKHSEEEIDHLINEVIKNNPAEAKRLKDGEQKLIGFFIGQIMKKAPQQSDPRIIRKRLIQALEQLNDREEK